MPPGVVSRKSISGGKLAEQRLHVALVVFLLGFFLNEALTIDLGPFFLRPEKISLLIGCVLLLRYAVVPFKVRGKVSLLLLVWVYYNLWMGLSVFWNQEYGTFLNQLNVLLKHCGEALLTCCIVGAVIRIGGVLSLRKILPLFMLFVLLEIVTGSLDYLAGQRVVPSGTRDAEYTYGIGIFGFHAERLFFAELMVIGTAISFGRLSCGGGNPLVKWLVLAVAPLFLLLLSSYTGILTYLLLLAVYMVKIGTPKGRALILALVLLGGGLLPNLYGTLTPDWFRESTAKKLEGRMEGGETSEWRFVTSAYLLERVVEEPTLFGKGYFSSKDEIGRFFDKAATSHTLISIPYEQGGVGVVLFGLLLILLLSHLFDLLRRSGPHQAVPPDLRLFIVAVSLCSLSRFLFYYQIANVYLYLLAVALLVSAKACRNNAVGTQLMRVPARPIADNRQCEY